MNLAPWHLIKLPVIFPPRGINLTMGGEEERPVGRTLFHALIVAVSVPLETVTSKEVVLIWTAYLKSICGNQLGGKPHLGHISSHNQKNY